MREELYFDSGWSEQAVMPAGSAIGTNAIERIILF